MLKKLTKTWYRWRDRNGRLTQWHLMDGDKTRCGKTPNKQAKLTTEPNGPKGRYCRTCND